MSGGFADGAGQDIDLERPSRARYRYSGDGSSSETNDGRSYADQSFTAFLSVEGDAFSAGQFQLTYEHPRLND
ncbi:hypothetical protein A5630_21280 [Mycolicibacterium mucogenicum]|uniref:Uncharacterized protein n=1 Tax=Mycolicibacterium mucogenicum TaxID=56689 RepID=A0A1A3H1S2_MYCMU|nr:hypothetical protein A5630_21280 [Mycolicibacterium mucogenicum]